MTPCDVNKCVCRCLACQHAVLELGIYLKIRRDPPGFLTGMPWASLAAPTTAPPQAIGRGWPGTHTHAVCQGCAVDKKTVEAGLGLHPAIEEHDMTCHLQAVDWSYSVAESLLCRKPGTSVLGRQGSPEGTASPITGRVCTCLCVYAVCVPTGSCGWAHPPAPLVLQCPHRVSWVVGRGPCRGACACLGIHCGGGVRG